jgi:hypothetical protein
MISRRGLVPLMAVVLVGGLLGGVPASLARFTAADAATAGFTTTRVLPPANLTGTGGATVALAWTPSVSTWATGYELLRSATSGSGYTVVASITPIAASTTGDNPPPGTWHYALRTTFHDWTSALGNEVSVVVTDLSVTTPPAFCGQQAAETANAGDNNGYESNPSRACGAPDGSTALDHNSGTSTTNSCVAGTKDKHRFWGYAIDLPEAVTAINGITVEPVLSQSNNGGTTWLCVQLSADGGSTWSTARRVTLTTNTLTTQTFGGPSETWGLAWTAADFGDGFRVRVIDSSTQGAKDFRLDAIGVSVTYTP